MSYEQACQQSVVQRSPYPPSKYDPLGQIGPGYVQAAAPSIKPTVASCASYIGAELDGIAAAIERLEAAAASVLSPTGSDGSQAKEQSPQALRSEAVSQLDALARRAAYLTSRINAIVGRLEL